MLNDSLGENCLRLTPLRMSSLRTMSPSTGRGWSATYMKTDFLCVGSLCHSLYDTPEVVSASEGAEEPGLAAPTPPPPRAPLGSISVRSGQAIRQFGPLGLCRPAWHFLLAQAVPSGRSRSHSPGTSRLGSDVPAPGPSEGRITTTQGHPCIFPLVLILPLLLWFQLKNLGKSQ